jgi:hypothetical protein
VGILVVLAGLVSLAVWRLWFHSPRRLWHQQPMLYLRALVVDYTVPFDDYKEHRGLIWLFNHVRLWGPKQPLWRVGEDYVGYQPLDRGDPRRVSQVDLSKVDLVYVADTYGVYRDDLLDIPNRRAHNDFNPLLFGGLSEVDAAALAAFSQHGTLMMEFNSWAEPTPSEARQVLEAVLGVNWTGWAGRVFPDPHDLDDVPLWLARVYGQQFPGEELPHQPCLVLMDHSGKLRLFPAKTLAEVTPRVVMTDAGRKRFPEASGAPYYYWFALTTARPEATVHATLDLPNLPGLSELLWGEKMSLATPFLVEYKADPAAPSAWNFSGDLADVDFKPGVYARIDAIDVRGGLLYEGGPTSEPVFWRFYAPVMRTLVVELVARLGHGTSGKTGPREVIPMDAGIGVVPMERIDLVPEPGSDAGQ